MLDVCRESKTGDFIRDEIAMMALDNYMIAVVDGVRAGEKDLLGSMYWVRLDLNGNREIVRDPLAYSLPFGVYAPAELFDMDKMYAERKDMDYFTMHYKTVFPDNSYRAKDIGSCLEIHTETATSEGTVAALTRRYKRIAAVISGNMQAGKEDIYEGLEISDLNYIGYDSIELMPEVPTSEREAVKLRTGEFFVLTDDSADEGTVKVEMKRPDISNWGYDTPVLGSIAVSPSILETLRPNEMVEFIETIHTMPDKPIQMAIDSVLGHCDFQGAFLLETFERMPQERENPKYVISKYLTGPNMYGRDIDFSNSNVKAMLIELLRRKIDMGYDCIRIDGAQDFIKERDEKTGFRIQDDVFLHELVSIVQDINGVKRRLDINLEDGRPWPDDLNWMHNSKYLDHSIEMTLYHEDVPKQWSPIIFAHNVHGKYKWFMDKWDRFMEVYRYGEYWITGQSNHDNARYFYKMVSSVPSTEYVENTPFAEYYNAQLGKTKKEVVHNAMDSNALSGLMLGFLPGNPMFLLNSLVHTPWMFLRDIDDKYAVEILSTEGAKFFEWYVDEKTFDRNDNFLRTKGYGFTDYTQLSVKKYDDENDGFLNRLYAMVSKVKTDAVAVRFLFETTDDMGHYDTVGELEADLASIMTPGNEAAKVRQQEIFARITEDQIDSKRRVELARKLMKKNEGTLLREKIEIEDTHSEEQLTGRAFIETRIGHNYSEIIKQLDKINYLGSLDDSILALLIEHSAMFDEYNIHEWSKDEELNLCATDALKIDGIIDPMKLKAFASAFLKDAVDACKVHKYEGELDKARVSFNFRLRHFRQDNPWLLSNPTNNVKKDYFARKLYINGARETGDWGDKGDLVNCNTIYYGWRTSPDATKQVFFIANMEGKPIDECPLNLFLNLRGDWNVMLHSPTLEDIPEVMDRDFKIKNFKNGEVIILEREI